MSRAAPAAKYPIAGGRNMPAFPARREGRAAGPESDRFLAAHVKRSGRLTVGRYHEPLRMVANCLVRADGDRENRSVRDVGALSDEASDVRRRPGRGFPELLVQLPKHILVRGRLSCGSGGGHTSRSRDLSSFRPLQPQQRPEATSTSASSL